MKALFAFLGTVMTFNVVGAPPEKPLIEKVNASGFTLPEYAYSETCRIFQKKAVIIRNFGRGKSPLVTYEERFLQTSGELKEVFVQVAKAKVVETENLLCDGPSTFTKTGTGELLFATGGCGQPTKVRQGPEAAHLRAIVDSICPVTHNGGYSTER
jgi:hypothetical protein